MNEFMAKNVNNKHWGNVKNQTVVFEWSAVLIKCCPGRKMTAA